MKRHINIPIFVPEVGCPHQCVFCNQSKITGNNETVSDGEAVDIIETYLSTADENTDVEIAFFGGSFTGICIDVQKRLLQLAYKYIDSGRVNGIRVSTRPDYISVEKLELLKTYRVTAIELGAQSLNNDVLRLTERGHSVEDVERASEMIKAFGFELGLQMMVGLPGDSRLGAIDTAKKIIDLGANTTRIYPCLVIRDTKLEQMYIDDRYSPLSIENAVGIVADIIPMFEKADVRILRVGLHASEGLTTNESLVAGPFHGSFRQLVDSEIWRRMIVAELACKYGVGELLVDNNGISLPQFKAVNIHCSSKEVNAAAGYNGLNRRYLEKLFGKVSFIKDDSLKGKEFYVFYN